MAAVKKFMFDTEFLDDTIVEEAESAPPPEPTYSQAELDATKAAAFADGRKTGLAEAATASDRLAAEALDAIGQRLATLRKAAGFCSRQRARGSRPYRSSMTTRPRCSPTKSNSIPIRRS